MVDRYEGWAFEGGEVKMNREANRLQVFFDEKPDRDTCSAMRHSGFKWAPSINRALAASKEEKCSSSLRSTALSAQVFRSAMM